MNSLSTGQNPNENYKNFCGQAINRSQTILTRNRFITFLVSPYNTGFVIKTRFYIKSYHIWYKLFICLNAILIPNKEPYFK